MSNRYKEYYEKIAEGLVISINKLGEQEKYFMALQDEGELMKEILQSIRRTKSITIVYLAEINKAKECEDPEELLKIMDDMRKLESLLKNEEIRSDILLLRAKIEKL